MPLLYIPVITQGGIGRAPIGGAPYKSAKDGGKGVGTLLSASAFIHKRTLMICLQGLDTLEANN